jgi:hypothetical protein
VKYYTTTKHPVNPVNPVIPVNYDFGKHWNTKIVPLLDHPAIKKAIKAGVNSYLLSVPTREKYQRDTPPARYATADWYDSLMMRKRDHLLEKLRQEGKLPAEYLVLEDLVKIQKPEEDDGEQGLQLLELQARILEPYTGWDAIKHDIESYCLFRGCHWYNPTFCLTLARLAEPHEAWTILAGNKHTTIINKSRTKVFDLQFWAFDGRIETYLFGDKIENEDPTMGGKEAYLYAMT